MTNRNDNKHYCQLFNFRQPLLSFVSALVLSCGIAVASPSTVSAATVSLSADCNVAANDSSLTPSAGDVLDISVTNGTNCQVSVSKTLVDSDSDINLTGTGSTTAVSQGSVWSFYPPNVTEITRLQITIGGSATGMVQFAGAGGAIVKWTIGSSSTTTTTTAPPTTTTTTPAPTLPATGQQTVLVGAAVLLIGLGALTTLSVRRRRDLNQMAQAVRHP